MKQSSIDHLCITTLRTLAIDAIQKAKSGHPGMPMGSAPMAYVLWTKFLRHSPHNAQWVNRDRFILSAGHGSMLLYGLLHLSGYDLSLDDLKKFRQLHSKTPGHPEYGHTQGVETTTGPLGQGFANGVGMAIAQKYLAAKFNTPDHSLFNYTIYGICGDGDLMEGVAAEAASLAGHLKLGNLIYLYDDNGISIDGSTGISFTEDVGARFEAYGWHVQTVHDGNNLEKIETAIRHAQSITDKPSLIKVKTHIGYGSPNKQDTSEVHGSPLGDAEVKLTKEFYEWDVPEEFFVPQEVRDHFNSVGERGKELEQQWNKQFESYTEHHPEQSAQLQKLWDQESYFDTSLLPVFTQENGNIATREASGKVLAAITAALPGLIGGSADLTPSNNTFVKGMNNFQSADYSGSYIRYGVREHAMGAIMNGIALTKGLTPYAGTFFVFTDYMRPAIRLAALMKIKPIYIFTHDSIGLGEDGPTHQPVEHLAALRAIPNVLLLRPCDANETAMAWKVALQHSGGPVALALTRQKVPLLDRTMNAGADQLVRGAYILQQNSENPELILIGTGSEVQCALGAYTALAKEGYSVRVVSMPSWELFEQQTADYKQNLFPSAAKKIAVEAGIAHGWHRYIGPEGRFVGMDSFGLSAPADQLFQHFKITADQVYAAAKELLARPK